MTASTVMDRPRANGFQAFVVSGSGNELPRTLPVSRQLRDANREYAYDRESSVGKLNTAWDEAVEKGWIVVSMKDDWNHVFPM